MGSHIAAQTDFSPLLFRQAGDASPVARPRATSLPSKPASAQSGSTLREDASATHHSGGVPLLSAMSNALTQRMANLLEQRGKQPDSGAGQAGLNLQG